MNRFESALRERVLVFDGAMGTAIQALPLDTETDFAGRENCSEILVMTRPDLVTAIHESFLAVGCDGVETNTFGANKLVFAEFDLVDQTYEINRRAAELALDACSRFSTADWPRFVIGAMGPGTRLVTLGNTDWDTMLDSYREQARGLIDGGVDALLVETCQDLLQAKCAVSACLAALADAGRSTDDVPIMVQVTIETTGTMLLGTEIAAAAAALGEYPILSLGLNCATGPVEMAEHVRWLSRHWRGAISVLPNAGLPILVDGRAEFPLGPEPFTRALLRMVEDDGVAMVGGCCGTTPEHLARLVEAVGGRRPAARSLTLQPPGASSLYGAVDFRQDASVLLVGERTNTSGSRAFKRMLEAEDWDGMVSLAREQVREGSHVIDINVDYAGRDGAADMAAVVSRFARQVNAPLMLDSTQSATLEAGLKHAGGKRIVNSTNLEDGEAKFGEICAMAKRYGAALVMLTIDEDPEEAMARTAERKLAIARRMVALATERHGLAASDLFIDPLVLPISTGMDKDRRSALETIEGVRAIARELPGVNTSVGLSNVSFGLKPAARTALNSVFLHELQAASLTAAIVHSSKILPRSRIGDERWEAALDLIHDRWTDGDPLGRFIGLFPDDEAAAPAVTLAELPLEERLQRHIIDGEKRDLVATLDAARQRYTPLAIINDHLLAGMKIVGERFGAGQMQLPFVLQSAEVMKMAVAHLEPFMDRVDGDTKGSIVLATVKGDVHDIGKNLVDIILTNNGYTVYNLGIKQPIGAIVAEWRARGANAIGLSGLLVKSVMVMQENLEELNEEGITAPVLVGGAALSRSYAETELRSTYRGPTFYGKDAFDGLRIMDLIAAGDLAVLESEIDQRVAAREAAMVRGAGKRAERRAWETSRDATSAGWHRSDVASDVMIPAAPFYGTRVVAGIRVDDVFTFINPIALFRGQWQFKQGSLDDDAYLALVEDEIRPVFERLKRRARDEAILQPAVVYGYFACNSEGDDLIVWDGPDSDVVRERFTFPRQPGGRRLCIADFFRSIDSGQRDVLGLNCVTMGGHASEVTAKLFADHEYTEYLYLHGLSVESAEALAELWHKRMRQELGIGADDSPRLREIFQQHYRGSRFSFGYPACPNMEDQATLFRLLQPERIGCTLTDNFQIDPEQSTSALMVHHPEAKYFNV